MKILAWHFCDVNSEGKPILRNGELAGSPGGTEIYNGTLKMCESGLHASINILNALSYAPCSYLRRVECSEGVLGGDKLVCRRRKILAVANMEKSLHEFACRCAERALRVANVTDTRYFAAIEAKRAWLRGDIGSRELAAAWAAACAAARDAAKAAACAAACAAARDATCAAAWDATCAAAKAAACAATCAAAKAAAWDTERQWQAEELEKMFWKIANKEN